MANQSTAEDQGTLEDCAIAAGDAIRCATNNDAAHHSTADNSASTKHIGTTEDSAYHTATDEDARQHGIIPVVTLAMNRVNQG